MNSYTILIMPSAQKDLDDFSGKILSRLEEKILSLHNHPRPHNSKKLHGSGTRWRIRIGDHRILYEIDDSEKTVKIYRIAHRKEVYK